MRIETHYRPTRDAKGKPLTIPPRTVEYDDCGYDSRAEMIETLAFRWRESHTVEDIPDGIRLTRKETPYGSGDGIAFQNITYHGAN